MNTKEIKDSKEHIEAKKAPIKNWLAVSASIALGLTFATGYGVQHVLQGGDISVISHSDWLSEGETYRAATHNEMTMLTSKLSEHMGGNVELLSAARTTVPQLYLLLLENDSFYYHTGEEKFIRGDIYNANTKVNETDSMHSILTGIANLNGHSIDSNEIATSKPNDTTQRGLTTESVDDALATTLANMRSNGAAKQAKEQSDMFAGKGLQMRLGALPETNTEPTLPREVVASQMAEYGDKKITSEMEKFNLNGRVDPRLVKTYRTKVEYQGSTFPRFGYDKDGKELAKEVKQRQIKTLVEFVERAGERWSLAYKAENEKASILVFTDPTCPFCKKFHKEIEQYNKAGISVYYLFYPRHIGMGMDNKNFKHTMSLLDSIWYSEDRNQAANDVFDGYRVSGKEVVGEIKNPVFEHYLLAEMVGIEGTPRILMSNGEEITGYLSWQHIAKQALK